MTQILGLKGYIRVSVPTGGYLNVWNPKILTAGFKVMSKKKILKISYLVK